MFFETLVNHGAQKRDYLFEQATRWDRYFKRVSFKTLGLKSSALVEKFRFNSKVQISSLRIQKLEAVIV